MTAKKMLKLMRKWRRLNDLVAKKLLDCFATCELAEEMKTREGVQEIVVEPYKAVRVVVDGKSVPLDINGGPCSILVVYD